MVQDDVSGELQEVHDEPELTVHIFHKELELSESYLLSFFNVAWSMYGASLGSELDLFSMQGKLITSILMIFSYVFQIYLTVKIVNLIDIIIYSNIKYYEAINQVEAYMEKMQFPIHLRNRIKTFYAKKFRGNYFKEDSLMANLPGFSRNSREFSNLLEFFPFFLDPLRKEIMINSGQAFIKKVHIFRHVSKDLLLSIISCMKKEQYLPNDLVSIFSLSLPPFSPDFSSLLSIFSNFFLFFSLFSILPKFHSQIYKAGTVGTRIYFIAHGTVSITTTNGKELNHLHDGDYFGEIALITNCLKVRLWTITIW